MRPEVLARKLHKRQAGEQRRRESLRIQRAAAEQHALRYWLRPRLALCVQFEACGLLRRE